MYYNKVSIFVNGMLDRKMCGVNVSMSFKKQLLDPLGTLCKLAALNFTEIKTKISIHDHVISLHGPNKWQGAVRFYNGDGKENVSELLNAFVRIIEWYLPQSSDVFCDESPGSNWMDIRNSDEIRKMVQFACSGLRNLQYTYEYGNVTLAIQCYINNFEAAVNDHFKPSMLPQYVLNKEHEVDNLVNYDKLRNFWDISKLRRITELYDECFSVKHNVSEIKVRDGLIESYLQSIYKLIEISDIEFQQLVLNSKKG